MVENSRHVPNLCVVNKVCGKCMEKPMNHYECDCKRTQIIFKGDSTLSDFCEWLFSGYNNDSLCIAHNAQGYDLHLIMDYVHNIGIKPKLIMNGLKIICLEACGLKFIDSLNFFNTALAKLPNMFGLEEMSKGFFPHLFSTRENQSYEGPMPDRTYYDPEGMHGDNRKAFDEWHAKQTQFNYQQDLIKYCIMNFTLANLELK